MSKSASFTYRSSIMLFSIFSYSLGVLALVAWIALLADLANWGLVDLMLPHLSAVVLTNIALIALFGIQHSVMARPSFKAWLCQWCPRSMERSVYVLMTAIVMFVIMIFWQTVPGMAWQVADPLWRNILWGLFIFGWVYLFLATFAINHFDLFGLRQAFLTYKNQDYIPLDFTERFMYQFNRHPIQTGILIGTWATPQMSNDHLLIAIGMSLYVFIGVYFEERDLIREHGETYEAYKRKVGGIFPWRYKS